MSGPSPEPTDPIHLLALHIGVAPDVLAAQLKALNLTLASATATPADHLERARSLEWERKLRDGTLSERNVIK